MGGQGLFAAPEPPLMSRSAMLLRRLGLHRLLAGRAFPLLVALVLCLFVFTASRFGDSSLLGPGRLFGDQEPAAPPPEPAQPAPEPEPEPKKPTFNRPDLPHGQCSPDIDFLRPAALGLTDNILYSRRCVKPVRRASVDRQAVVDLPGPLVPEPAHVNLTSCAHPSPSPCREVQLDVSLPYPAEKYPQLLFGVTTSLDRLEDALDGFVHWLPNSGAKMLAIVVDASDPGLHRNMTALQARYHAAGIDASFMPPTNENWTTSENHFAIIRPLLAAATPRTTWLGILDDDTFFPSLYPLARTLASYDHTKSMWLGALTEAFDHLKAWGFMAFGGAGAFLSVPLAKQLEPHIEQCLVETTQPTGDCMLRDCVYTHTKTKLTVVPGLWQHDIRGNVDGFYESGENPLSLHHWKTWYQEPLPKMAKAADWCADCFLQRWTFGGDTLLANGFSVTSYRDGLKAVDLDKMEGTWQHPGHQYDFSLGPLRPWLNRDQKKSYKLLDVQVTDDNKLRQIYVFKGDLQTDQWDEVFDLIWDS